MLAGIILLALLVLAAWLLFAPLVLVVQSRRPGAEIKWRSIGYARIWFDDEWMMRFRIFFFRKTIRLAALQSKPAKKRNGGTEKKKQKSKPVPWKKITRVIGSFRVVAWTWELDTGDYAWNGLLYPLNAAPPCRGHLFVNFAGKNSFYIEIRNRPANMLRAFLR